MSRRHRDAGTGEFVTAKEAERRPRETVSETVRPCRCDALEERIALLERAVVAGEAHAKRILGCR